MTFVGFPLGHIGAVIDDGIAVPFYSEAVYRVILRHKQKPTLIAFDASYGVSLGRCTSRLALTETADKRFH